LCPIPAKISDLDAVLGEYHRALDAFFRGDSSPVKPLYSRGDGATLANPFGPARRGWGEIEETMDRAAANYRDGRTLGFDEVSRLVATELAYVVEVEHYEAKVAGSAETTAVSLRCTNFPSRGRRLEGRPSARGSDHGGSTGGVGSPDLSGLAPSAGEAPTPPSALLSGPRDVLRSNRSRTGEGEPRAPARQG